MKHLFAFALVVAAAACGSKSPAPAPTTPDVPAPGAGCVRTGCSSTMCLAEGAEGGITTCEFRPEYACYASAACERQADGECGWTTTPELAACLENPPAAE